MVSLKKKEDIFFVYLKEFVYKIDEACNIFCDLVNNYENIEEKVAKIKDCEVECDSHAHNIFVAIHGSFITPFDREDLYAIVKEMDDIIDAIEQVSSRFIIFDIKELNKECLDMSQLINQAIKELVILFEHLSEIKKNSIVKEQIIEVNRVENEGDIIFRNSLTKLFREEKDPIELIKWKHLYEQLEICLDSCECVANIVGGVVMKHV